MAGNGFKPLYEVFDGRLSLPGKDGRVYHVPEPDRELGLWCTAFCAAGVAANLDMDTSGMSLPPLVLDDDQEEAMYRRILGPVWDQLQGDGYGFTTQKHFALTALLWVGMGHDAAMAFWNSGGDPKASAPRWSRRERPHPRQSTVSTRSTDEASTTPPPASMSGTRRRRRRSRK